MMIGFNQSPGSGCDKIAAEGNHLHAVPQVTSPVAIDRLRAGGEVCGCSPDLIWRNVPEDLHARLEVGKRWMGGTLWFVASLTN